MLDVAASEIEVYEDTGMGRDTQWDSYQKLMTDVRAGEIPNVRPYVAGSDRGEPSEVSPHPFCHSITFRMIRREDKCLKDVMLQLRHSSI